MNNREFDNIIKKSAQQRETDVPDDIWGNISAKKKKRRFPFFWLIFFSLLAGGTAVVWNRGNNKNTAGFTIAKKSNTDKTDHVINNKETTQIKVNGKDKIIINAENKLSDQRNDKAGADANSPVSMKTNSLEKNKANNADLPITDANTIPTGNKKRKNTIAAIIPGKKQMPQHIKNNDDQKNYASSPKKQIRKGTSRINIYNPGLTSPGEEGLANNIIVDSFIPRPASVIVKEVSATVIPDAGDRNELEENNIKQTAVSDSDINKKITITASDSMDKRTTSSTKQKKPAPQYKNNGITIEAGVTIALPVQQYEQPLYVTRVKNTSSSHAEFISNSIKTKVETGGGINISLAKEINKKWSIGTGIRYLRFTEHLQMSGIETTSNFTIVQRLETNAGGSFLKTDTVTSVSKSNTTLTGRNVYNNYGIPLFVRYNFITAKKWHASFTTGMYIDLFKKYKNNIAGEFETTNTGGSKQTSVKNTTGIDIFAGLHVNGALYKKYDWFFEATGSYSLSRYKTSNLSFNKRIHIPGISVGIAYKIRKR